MLIFLFLIIISTNLFSLDQYKDITIKERAYYKMKIEEIYQRNRTGKENFKMPPFEFFERKAMDDIRYSIALEKFFNYSITEEKLQAEMDRIAKNTKKPETLKQIFDLLGNDPGLIAEIYVREILSRRLLESFYYSKGFKEHADLRKKVEEEIKNLRSVEDLKKLSGEYFETSFYKKPIKKNLKNIKGIGLSEKEWKDYLGLIKKNFNGIDGELKEGMISRIIDNRNSITVLGVLKSEKDYIRLGICRWKKKTFSEWWNEIKKDIPLSLNYKKAKFRTSKIYGNSCKDDTWYPLPFKIEPREKAISYNYGDYLVIWGGYSSEGILLNTGFKYDLINDTVTEISNTNAPSQRIKYSYFTSFDRIWIFGGQDLNGNYLNTGAEYNISYDTWQPFSTENAPSPRAFSAMCYSSFHGGPIIFGGENESGKLNDMYVYTSGGSWLVFPYPNPPSPRAEAGALYSYPYIYIWGGRGSDNQPLNTGKKLYLSGSPTWYDLPVPSGESGRYAFAMFSYGDYIYIWGGKGPQNVNLNTGIKYNKTNNTWAQMSSTNAPSPREGYGWATDPNYLYVWGGRIFTTQGYVYFNNGGKYSFGNDTWTTITSNIPGRAFHTCIMYFNIPQTRYELIIFGGRSDSIELLNDGYRYIVSQDVWIPLYEELSPTDREAAKALWTGNEVIIWGGRSPSYDTSIGGKYDPISNTWFTIAQSPIVERSSFAFHWTGDKIIVWGGDDALGYYLNDGAFYNPSEDSWEIIDTTDPDTPSPRSAFASVWTGEKMIVWGGWIDAEIPFANDGAKFDPQNSEDPWVPISTDGAPRETGSPEGIWTGSKMIVWGGEIYDAVNDEWLTSNEGGIYDPAQDSWSTVTTENAPSRRYTHMVSWNGSEMMVWGGDNYYESLGDGGLYDPETNSWTPITLENAPSARCLCGHEWNGKYWIIWAGADFYIEEIFNDGFRYLPSEDRFIPMSSTGRPLGTFFSSTAWTGKYFFVWGGRTITDQLDTGGLYCACNQPPVKSTNPSPSNNSKVCLGSTINFTCENEEATSFDIYIDSNLECENVNECFCSRSLGEGDHSWYVIPKNYCGEQNQYDIWNLSVITSPGAASNPNPPNGSYKCSLEPTIATWTPGTYSQSYDVYLNGEIFSNCEDLEEPTCNFGTLSSGEYNWYVVCKNICGSQQSSTWNFSVDPSLPSEPSNPNPGNGSSVCPDPDLSWTASSNARYYDVYFNSNLLCSNITETTCDPGQISFGSHNWQVIAKNGCGNVESQLWTFSIKNPPSDVTNPDPENGGEVCTRTPILSFAAAQNAETYDVYVDNELKCADITSTSCQPGELSIGEHSWYVVAKNGCPEHNNQSETWIFYVDDQSPGQAPIVFPPNGSYVCPNPVLDWDPAQYARRYDIYLDEIKICNNIATTYCNTTVTSGTHYWYLYSKNRCGQTRTPPGSATLSFSILSVPSQPSVQDKDVCELSGVEISWNAVEGATSYDLRVDGTTIIYNVTSPYTYEPGNSNSHSYEIRAKNTYCTTAWSTSASGIDENQTPSTPSITSIQDVDICAQSGIKIYYNAGSPATRHDLYRNGEKVVENYVSGDTYNPGSTSNYIYYIKAVNGTCSKDSSTQEFADANNTPTPTISGENQNNCPDEFVLLSTQTGMTDYQWYRNGQSIEGANSYQYNATLSGSYTVYYKNSYGCGNTSEEHSVTIVACYGPEPVADGKLYGNPAIFKKASDFNETGNIDVTYDNQTCSDHHISILYGNLTGENNFDGYDGCALSNGGNSGSATFNSTGQENVWYNIIWVSSSGRAGHPGYYYYNGEDLQRNWSALGFCSITSEMQNDPSCNGNPGP